MWLLSVLVTLLLATPAWSATYYVAISGSSDSNPCVDGNINAPKRNISGPSGGISCLFPGDTLFIREGTYFEQIRPPGGSWMRSGTGENSRITIAGYQQETVILQPFGGNAVLSLEQTGNFAWMTFERLIFDGVNTQGVAHIAGDTHHLRFRNCELKNSHVDGNSHGFGGSGGHHHEFLHTYIHHVTGYGAYFSGADSVWDHMTIVDNGGYGLHFYDKASHIDNTVVRNSVIARNGFNNQFGGGGIVLFHGANQQVYNNLIYNNFEGVGIRSSCENCKVYNNTIYGNQFRAIQIFGETFDYEYPPGSGIFRRIRPPTDIKLQNNILLNSPQIIDNQNGTGTVISNNLCPTCDFTGPPNFEDAANAKFKITAGSDAINHGITLSSYGGVTTDYDGNTRNQGPWDIGAYAFNQGVQPCPPNCPPSGNAIHVAQVGGTPTTDCVAAENPLTPIRTLTDGLKCMHLTPGKTLWLHAGTYAECLDTSVTPLKGGAGPSFTTATTISTWGTDLVTIRPGACAQSGGAFALKNGAADSFLIFRGSATNRLVIDGINNYNNLILSTGIHHVRLEYVHLPNGGQFEGIYAENTSNIELVDSIISGATTSGIVWHATTTGWLIERTMIMNSGGIGVFHNTGTLNGLTIKESTLKDNGGGGVSLGTGSGTTLINSQVKTNTGIGMLIRSGASNVSVHNDTFYANTGNGIQCDPGAIVVSIKNTISTGNGGTQVVNNCRATIASVSETGVIFAGAPTKPIEYVQNAVYRTP